MSSVTRKKLIRESLAQESKISKYDGWESLQKILKNVLFFSCQEMFSFKKILRLLVLLKLVNLEAQSSLL